MTLCLYLFLSVTLASIVGGLLRWSYPLMFKIKNPKIRELNIAYVLLISFCLGLLLSAYFYIGMSNVTLTRQFLMQLALISAVLVFGNIDRLHEIHNKLRS